MSETDKQESPLKNAFNKIETNDWIYFIKPNPWNRDFGDVYKIRPDETELTCLWVGYCEELRIVDGELHFIEWEENDCYKGYTVDYKKKEISLPLDFELKIRK